MLALLCLYLSCLSFPHSWIETDHEENISEMLQKYFRNVTGKKLLAIPAHSYALVKCFTAWLQRTTLSWALPSDLLASSSSFFFRPWNPNYRLESLEYCYKANGIPAYQCLLWVHHVSPLRKDYTQNPIYNSEPGYHSCHRPYVFRAIYWSIQISMMKTV